MKTFDEYQNGEWVTYKNPGHEWHLMQFQAYKSEYTYNAFRLKFGAREVIADISEVSPIQETNKLIQQDYENFSRDFSGSPQQGRSIPLRDDDPYSDFQD